MEKAEEITSAVICATLLLFYQLARLCIYISLGLLLSGGKLFACERSEFVSEGYPSDQLLY